MNKYKILTIIIFFALILLGSVKVYAQGSIVHVTEKLRKRLTFYKTPQKLFCMGKLLCGSLVLPQFYSLQEFTPSWITNSGLRKQAYHLVQTIKAAEFEGLNPQDYHLDEIEILLKDFKEPPVKIASIPIEKMVELELLLTDAFFLYTSHVSSGRVNPETIHSEWTFKNKKVDLIRILQDSIRKGKIADAIETVQPQSQDYRRLKKALIAYKKIAENGRWPRTPKGPIMKKGDRGDRIAILQSRLVISGDLKPTKRDNSDVFGETLKKAVLKFQKRHGLAEDGIVGRATLSALNVSVNARLKQIKLNMERWRWLQRDFGSRYLLVNIADFRLSVIEKRSSILKMRVVVGKNFRRTPVFVDKMTYMVTNPFWNIPHKLARDDFLSRIKKDPDFLKNQKIRVYESWKYGAQQIDAESVNWKMLGEKNFFYKLVQEPGPLNALGRIKFMFPNKFSVYLHDTPAKHLFNIKKRNFSSGCIRIEKPIELATYLLQDDPNWTRQKILDAIDSLGTKIIRLPKPIPIWILYFTAWVDEGGIVHFRNDVYHRDRQLAKALEEKPPA